MVSSPSLRKKYSETNRNPAKHQERKKVYVIFGGDTSERQVSLMSGTNVWLNLQAFDDVSFQHKGLSVTYGTLEPSKSSVCILMPLSAY